MYSRKITLTPKRLLLHFALVLGLDANGNFSKPRLNTNHLRNSSPSLKLVPKKFCTAEPVTGKAIGFQLSWEKILLSKMARGTIRIGMLRLYYTVMGNQGYQMQCFMCILFDRFGCGWPLTYGSDFSQQCVEILTQADITRRACELEKWHGYLASSLPFFSCRADYCYWIR